MAERERKRKRERAAEWEWRKRGRRKREGREGDRRMGWTSDPMEALGEDVMGRVMEFLDARSVARCTAVSRAWRGVAADNRLWAPKCAELMAGKAHIPRLTLIHTGSKLSTYSMAIMDGKRSRITKEDLCDHAWEYRFTIAAPEYWRNLDPSWKHTGPPMRRYFHPDGYHSADPHDAVWGGHECTYTVITSFVGDGQIREHYVRINRWPPMKVSRKNDWSWELSNHLYRYNSIPDSNKKGCTGPLFPVWAGDVAELLGMMVEDHKRIQPNARTYALLVECFTKYCMVNESIRHFRALRRIPGGTKVLYNEGNCGDPLSLYLRSLCLDGRPVELLDALEAMANDNQSIAPRAMILNRKYRTLVSSWIEPLQEEADVGFEIDYVARYIEEGGLTGERKRWVPRRGKTPLDPDEFGFAYSNPIETSFKQRCFEELKLYHRKLLITLRNEGPGILGDVSEEDVRRVIERLKKLVVGPKKNVIKPKAASKMVVSELKTELEAQGLPTDGTRQVLYQRVQKARRINRSRGVPLWVPPVEDEEVVDEGLDELISRIKPEDGNTEFWKRRFLGETRNYLCEEDSKEDNQDLNDELEDDDDEDDDDDESVKEAEEDEIDDEEVVEQTENQAGDETKDKPAKGPNHHLQMIGVQLLKDLEKTPVSSKKSKRMPEIDDDEDWFPEDPIEAFKVMREERMFDVSDMYTTADAWGWTWEREIKNTMPRKWSQEWEVELAIKIMDKVIELGGTPTIGDCAIILRAAMRAPLPSAFIPILHTTHSLGYKFGSPLYDEVVLLCLDLEEIDAAIAVVAEMETSGIKVPDETLDKVLASKQSGNSALPTPTED